MSEHGWREFLAADNVDDWVVLHGGATAVFQVRSLVDAARLADAVAHEDNAVDPLGHGPTVWLQELDEAKPLWHAMKVDVSVAQEHAEARLAAALAAGGRVVDDSNAPAHWTLADPAGNRVCICAWPDGATAAGPTSASAGGAFFHRAASSRG